MIDLAPRLPEIFISFAHVSQSLRFVFVILWLDHWLDQERNNRIKDITWIFTSVLESCSFIVLLFIIFICIRNAGANYYVIYYI